MQIYRGIFQFKNKKEILGFKIRSSAWQVCMVEKCQLACYILQLYHYRAKLKNSENLLFSTPALTFTCLHAIAPGNAVCNVGGSAATLCKPREVTCPPCRPPVSPCLWSRCWRGGDTGTRRSTGSCQRLQEPSIHISAPVSPDTALQATSLHPAAQFNRGRHITRHLNLVWRGKKSVSLWKKKNNSQKGVLSSRLSDHPNIY